MLILDVAEDSARLEYTVKEIAKLLGIEIRIHANARSDTNYLLHNEHEVGGVLLSHSPILQQKGVSKLSPEMGFWDEIPVLFPNQRTSEVPFDFLGAVFYLLSRMEEYQLYQTDNHGRFRSEDSIVIRAGIENLPIIELWANKLRVILKQRIPTLEFQEPSFSLLPTFDIDSAFAFAHKGLMRTAGGFAKDILNLNSVNAIDRLLCVVGLKSDPYDVYSRLEEMLSSKGMQAKFFFLLSDFGPMDKGVPYSGAHLQRLIRALGARQSIGIHPGYRTYNNREILNAETNRLSDILGKAVVDSRQHYLRFQFPETAEHLISCGITDDYTMGFADRTGFRAGTSRHFGFFNLRTNQEEALCFHPFVCMDSTLRFYMDLSPSEASKTLETIKIDLRKIGSLMTVLWHNESLSEYGLWRGWSEVFKTLISKN